MTGNNSLLQNFKEYNGGPVAFGGATGGYITGKGMITNGKLSVDRVNFVKELEHNLLSVSQFCDQNHHMFFTEHECMVLKPGVKIPEEYILLKAPRDGNMYKMSMWNTEPNG